ncbi:hypothetical protein SAMN05892883_1875 [Jatrophihabitans sp. GAS493]|uniref:hypothetical protein n=1 Tax=Jatrophihabitans sp. GAS493 TaxID=1907575 RepID=UPI000BB82217|nr:hypothetical protein [Jatrophihabitans sp. GAS493]SOD72485.1 hypothetical protein SAMN05892883_1875 [Jatrophihabitans sp. GAS493]
MSEAQSQLQVHSGHLAMLAGWLVIFAAVYVRDKVRSRNRGAAPAPSVRLRVKLLGYPGAVAATSVVAGVIHLLVIREHFEEAALYGWFFLVLTLLQFGYAGWVIWRPTRALLTAGGLASLGVVVLWLATRTIAIPLGPAAGEKEAFGTLDVLCSVTELLTVILCALAVRALDGRTSVRSALMPSASVPSAGFEPATPALGDGRSKCL